MSDALTAQLPQCLPRLWRFALRLTRNSHLAQDLVQRTCLRALEKKHLYQEQQQLLSWLFAIQHRLWLDELSATKPTIELDDDYQESLDPNTQPDDHLFYQQVRRALEQLREPYRSVMLLVAVEEYSYDECARILDIPVGTVMSRLSRARQIIGAQFSTKSNAVAAPAAPIAAETNILRLNPVVKQQIR